MVLNHANVSFYISICQNGSVLFYFILFFATILTFFLFLNTNFSWFSFLIIHTLRQVECILIIIYRPVFQRLCLVSMADEAMREGLCKLCELCSSCCDDDLVTANLPCIQNCEHHCVRACSVTCCEVSACGGGSGADRFWGHLENDAALACLK